MKGCGNYSGTKGKVFAVFVELFYSIVFPQTYTYFYTLFEQYADVVQFFLQVRICNDFSFDFFV